MFINISNFSFWRNVPEYWFLDREVNCIAMIGCLCWTWFLKLDLENIFVLVLISNIYINLALLIFLSIYWCVCGGGALISWVLMRSEFLFSWMTPNVAYTTHLSTRRGRCKGTWPVYPLEREIQEITTSIWKQYFCGQRGAGIHKRKQIFSSFSNLFATERQVCSSIWKLRILVPYIDFLSSLSSCILTPSFFYVLQGETFSYIVFIRIISPQKLPVTPQNT